MIGTIASTSLGSVLRDPGTFADPLATDPFMLEINGADWREWWQAETLHITDTLGQPVSCEFTILNPSTKPRPGDRVRVRYYADVLFAGLITRVEPQPGLDFRVVPYLCECTDWSILLTRRKLRRNFTNLPVANIVDSILDNELAGDGLSIGTIDQGSTIPLVDVRNAKVFDVLRDVSGATGQAMYVDFNKAIQFRTSTNEPAPKVLDYTTVEGSSMIDDLETYRNVQTVIVTGTPTQGQDANTATVTRQNDDQIAARQEIEGGTGRYEDIEEVVHPTSNAGADLALMGIGYAQLRLATSGTPRKTLRVSVRGYGFRAGQFATVDLPGLGVSGTWLIQRSTYVEQAKQHLLFALELTQSSRQQRAYEAWLSIVKAGKVVVQLPAAITSNLATFNTPGTTTWTSPVTGQVEFTCVGGSGGGSNGVACSYPGGNGGPSGRAVTVISAVAGQVYDVVVGAFGDHSALLSGGPIPPPSYYLGFSGTASRVSLSGVVLCQGDGGGGGTAAYDNALNCIPPTNGTPGSGIGDGVTIGGGRAGGAGAPPLTTNTATGGQDGFVEIRW